MVIGLADQLHHTEITHQAMVLMLSVSVGLISTTLFLYAISCRVFVFFLSSVFLVHGLIDLTDRFSGCSVVRVDRHGYVVQRQYVSHDVTFLKDENNRQQGHVNTRSMLLFARFIVSAGGSLAMFITV